jgi:hypothetical protein
MQVIWDLGKDKVDNLCSCWTGQPKDQNIRAQNIRAGYLGPW